MMDSNKVVDQNANGKLDIMKENLPKDAKDVKPSLPTMEDFDKKNSDGYTILPKN